MKRESMRETVTTADGRVFLLPSEEEDERITQAAMTDPDSLPVTEEEWRRIQPTLKRCPVSEAPVPPLTPPGPGT